MQKLLTKGFFLLALISTTLLPLPSHAAAGTVGSGNCQSSVSETSYFTAGTTGNYCLLTFKASTSTSTISATWTVPAGVQTIQVLIVGGGGGGGSDIGGGGGGGQVIESTTSVTPGSSPSLTAGRGGATGNGTYSTNNTLNNTGGVTGTSSSFSSISALGGSGAIGRTKNSGVASGWDFNGWTGGGAGVSVGTTTAGVGGDSFKGGIGGSLGGGGGGGAGGVGSAGSANGGAGGTGISSSITGSPVCYGGGGGGGSNNSAGSATCGGQSGTVSSPTPTTASPGFGGGGGGGGGNGAVNGGGGGSGVVIIKWLPGQTISFTQLSDQNKNSASTASLTATSTSNLAVTFTSSTPSICSIASSTVNLLAQGNCTIVASQAGSSSYQAAPSLSMTFTIGGDIAFSIAVSSPLVYRTSETLSISTSTIAGKVSFKQGKTRIPGCISLSLNAGNSYSVTCNWKPTAHGAITITATLTPTSGTYSTTTQQVSAFVSKRISLR